MPVPDPQSLILSTTEALAAGREMPLSTRVHGVSVLRHCRRNGSGEAAASPRGRNAAIASGQRASTGSVSRLRAMTMWRRIPSIRACAVRTFRPCGRMYSPESGSALSNGMASLPPDSLSLARGGTGSAAGTARTSPGRRIPFRPGSRRCRSISGHPRRTDRKDEGRMGSAAERLGDRSPYPRLSWPIDIGGHGFRGGPREDDIDETRMATRDAIPGT